MEFYLSLVFGKGGSIFLYFLASLVEASTSNDSIPGSVLKSNFYRILVGIWLISMTSLTNGFKGLVITGLNSKPVSIVPENFEDIVCFNESLAFFNKTSKTQQQAALRKRWFSRMPNGEKITNSSDSSCFSILSSPKIIGTQNDQPVIGYELMDFLYNLISIDVSNNPVKLTILSYNLLNPKHSYEPKEIIKGQNVSISHVEYAIEKELVDCDKKSVFAGNSDEIDNLQRYLGSKYYWLDWTLGKNKDSILHGRTGWKFRLQGGFGTKGDKFVVKWFKSLIETGIYFKLLKDQRDRRFVDEERVAATMEIVQKLKNKPSFERKEGKQLKLEDNIYTIFIIWAGLLVISLGSFLIEGFTRVLNC
jgi:hypothetical protein